MKLRIAIIIVIIYFMLYSSILTVQYIISLRLGHFYININNFTIIYYKLYLLYEQWQAIQHATYVIITSLSQIYMSKAAYTWREIAAAARVYNRSHNRSRKVHNFKVYRLRSFFCLVPHYYIYFTNVAW